MTIEQPADSLLIQFNSPSDYEGKEKFVEWVTEKLTAAMPIGDDQFEILWVNATPIPEHPNAAVILVHRRIHPWSPRIVEQKDGTLRAEDELVGVKPERRMFRKLQRRAGRHER